MKRYIVQKKKHIMLLSLVLIVSGFLIGASIKSILLMIAAIIAGLPIGIKAYGALKLKVFSIELLVTVAVIGALLIGEYTEAAVVTFLFLFGDYLEARSLEKTRTSLQSLLDMAPQEAIVMRNNVQMTIPAEEVMLTDKVVLHAGGKVPVDGTVVSGTASLKEAAVTGESVPVFKKTNDLVYSGTMVDNGYIEIKPEKIGEATTFAKIIELVEEAQETKTATEKFLNKFAAVYTPLIVVIAMMVYILFRDMHMAITFLVIACPGALVIGAPVSTVTGIGNGAKHGVLIKGGEVLDALSKVDIVFMDKTGTLTKGRPEVTEMRFFTEKDQTEVVSMIASLEKTSEHHLGKAIVRKAEERNCTMYEAEKVEVMKGKGIRALIKGKAVMAGNEQLLDMSDVPITDEVFAYVRDQEKRGYTAVIAVIEGQIEAVLSIADEIREDAKQTIRHLRRSGVKQLVMLTGDNAPTAKLVADHLELDHVHASLLPEEKLAIIQQYKQKGHTVAMLGDGINDAPSIATAHIGVAMGRSGTDVAMETADVVLLSDKLHHFAYAKDLAKATMKNMKQNTWIAVSVVFLLLLGVLGDWIHLASGMFIHEASVLVVILNGMRLRTFSKKKETTRQSRAVKYGGETV